jgi:hypothetical protein
MSDAAAYREWKTRALVRFEGLYRRDESETLGEVVPRPAVDPECDFRIDQAAVLVNEFLAGVNHKMNPFLNSPERMARLGFIGTPYRFDIERDRKNRAEW